MDEKGDFLSALIQAMLLRSVGTAAGESTIEERWSDIIASRSSVRLREWLGAIAGGLVSFVGLVLVGYPLLKSGAVASVWDALLIGCGAALAALVFWAGVEVSLQDYAPGRRWAVIGMGVTLILCAVALAAMRAGDDARWYHSLSIVVGLAVLLPSVMFTFNQLADLRDPMGWQSAFERRIGPLLDHWMERQAPPKVVERPLIPWTHGNRREWFAHQAESENVINVPALDDLTLADFLKEAINRGLGRRNWIEKGKKPYICPTSKERVTRPTYDRMIEMMERLGYIERGGDGEATTWLVEPTEAYDDWCSRIEDEWGDLLKGAG